MVFGWNLSLRAAYTLTIRGKPSIPCWIYFFFFFFLHTLPLSSSDGLSFLWFCSTHTPIAEACSRVRKSTRL